MSSNFQSITASVLDSSVKQELGPSAGPLGAELQVSGYSFYLKGKAAILRFELSKGHAWQLSILVEPLASKAPIHTKIQPIPLDFVIGVLSKGLAGHWPRYLSSAEDLKVELRRVNRLLERFGSQVLLGAVDWEAAVKRLEVSLSSVAFPRFWGRSSALRMTLDAADTAFGREYFDEAKRLYESVESKLGPEDRNRLEFLRNGFC